MEPSFEKFESDKDSEEFEPFENRIKRVFAKKWEESELNLFLNKFKKENPRQLKNLFKSLPNDEYIEVAVIILSVAYEEYSSNRLERAKYIQEFHSYDNLSKILNQGSSQNTEEKIKREKEIYEKVVKQILNTIYLDDYIKVRVRDHYNEFNPPPH